jgi:hypothetical protein
MFLGFTLWLEAQNGQLLQKILASQLFWRRLSRPAVGGLIMLLALQFSSHRKNLIRVCRYTFKCWFWQHAITGNGKEVLGEHVDIDDRLCLSCDHQAVKAPDLWYRFQSLDSYPPRTSFLNQSMQKTGIDFANLDPFHPFQNSSAKTDP